MGAEAEVTLEDLKIAIEKTRMLSTVRPEDEGRFHNRNITLEL